MGLALNTSHAICSCRILDNLPKSTGLLCTENNSCFAGLLWGFNGTLCIKQIYKVIASVEWSCNIFETLNEKQTPWRYRERTNPGIAHHQLITPNQFDLGTSKMSLQQGACGRRLGYGAFHSTCHLNLLPGRTGPGSANSARGQSWSGNCWSNFSNIYTKCYK